MDAVVDALRTVRRALVEQCLSLDEADLQALYAQRLGQVHGLLYNSPVREAPCDADDRALIDRLVSTVSATGFKEPTAGQVLAAMLMLYPHQTDANFPVFDVPEWLRTEYVNYLLARPPLFREPGEADGYARFVSRFAEYVLDGITGEDADNATRNLGGLFTQGANFSPIYSSGANVKDVMHRRARIMEATMAGAGHALDHKFAARTRPKLRLGVLATQFGPDPETLGTLPVYQHIDRGRFDVSLFALRTSGRGAAESACASHADRLVTLPKEFPQQVQAIRNADLDILFIGSNVTSATSAVAALAMHRLARVQVAGVTLRVTSGMRNVDYFLSGKLSEPAADAQAHHTERLVTVDGPAHCFAMMPEAANAPGAPALTRELLGIPDGAVVFASGANFHKILPEVDDAWARILAAAPESRLMIYPFNPNLASNYAGQALIERLTAALERRGVVSERLIVLRPMPARADVLARLRLADVYLDSFPFSGAASLLDPLEVGLPTVVMEGNSLRTSAAAAMVRDLEVDELIARDVDGYVDLATRLARDADVRASLRERITSEMKAVPKFLDAEWYGKQVEALFEKMLAERKTGA